MTTQEIVDRLWRLCDVLAEESLWRGYLCPFASIVLVLVVVLDFEYEGRGPLR